MERGRKGQWMQFKNMCIPSVLRAGNWRHTFVDDFALSPALRQSGPPKKIKKRCLFSGDDEDLMHERTWIRPEAPGRCSLELLTVLTFALGNGWTAGPSTILWRKIRALGGATGSAKMETAALLGFMVSFVPISVSPVINGPRMFTEFFERNSREAEEDKVPVGESWI